MGGSLSCSSRHGPQPQPYLAAFPSLLVHGCCPKGGHSVLQRRPPAFLGLVEFSVHPLEPSITAPALPSLAPGHLSLSVAGEPAPGTSGPASLCQSQHLETLRQSLAGHICAVTLAGISRALTVCWAGPGLQKDRSASESA